MIAVVYKDKSTLLHVSFEVSALLLRKLHQLMSTQVAKGTFENLGTAELHNFFSFSSTGIVVYSTRLLRRLDGMR